jgi:LL-diaminopimelate aminotransferase
LSNEWFLFTIPLTKSQVPSGPPPSCIAAGHSLPSATYVESFIQNLFAERIGGRLYGKSTAIYKFEKIKRAKRAALAANPGAEIIDMGVGEPDEMAFSRSGAKALRRSAPIREPGLCRQWRRGAEAGRSAIHGSRLWVAGINPETEVMHSIGSKAALSILPAALINPGDYVLMTTPAIRCSARTPNITGARP